MKMVSAAKLKKAQDAITAMRPYADKLTELLQNLSATLEGDLGGTYTTPREVNKVLLVVINSNRGLCGGFNSSVFKATVNAIEDKYKDVDVSILAIGKKANDLLSKQYNVINNQSNVYDTLSHANVSKIAESIMTQFTDGEFDKVELIYNKFKNAATQILTNEVYLPIEQTETESTSNLDYLYEPSKQVIIDGLIPKSLKMQLYKAIRDSFAAEHGARMTAMHKATDNANDLRDELLLQYNKARQAAITGEILEIVGGSEALNN